MAFNPYAYRAGQETLVGSLLQSELGRKMTGMKVGSKINKDIKEFNEQLKRAEAAARKKAKKHGGLFKGLRALSMFMGPLGAGLTNLLASGGQAHQAKKGMKLLKKYAPKGWENTHLAEAYEDFLEQSEEAQIDTSDIAEGALLEGLFGALTAKMGGSKKIGSGKGLLKGGGTPFRSMLENVGLKPNPKTSGGQAIKGQTMNVENLFSPDFIGGEKLTLGGQLGGSKLAKSMEASGQLGKLAGIGYGKGILEDEMEEALYDPIQPKYAQQRGYIY